jgi:hypothetical protein
MISEIAKYRCIQNGKGIIEAPELMEPIELFDIQATASYPLILNKDNNFTESKNPIVEIIAFYNKELLINSPDLINLITRKTSARIDILDNEISDFYNVVCIPKASVSGIDLSQGKLYFLANDFIENLST